MVSLPDILLPKQQYFGLSIDRTAIRAVEISQRGTLRAIAELLFPEELFTDGILTHKEYFTRSIQSLYQTGKFTSPYVIVSFPEAYAYTRAYTLPKIPLDDVNEAVSWHVKDLFPFPEGEIYYDWKILGTTEKDITVAVVAVPKKVLDPLKDALIDAGLKPLRFEPDASVIARLLQLGNDQAALVTDVSEKGAYVTLVEGQKATFTTVVNVTAEDTPEAYVKNINQTLTEIASFYKTKGVLKEESLAIVLTGELATEEWAKQAASIISYPMKILRTQVKPSFNKAYAVATARVTPPRDEQTINLLPEQMQAHYDNQRTTAFYKTLLLRTCIFFIGLLSASILCFVAVSIRRQQLDKDVKNLSGSTKALGPERQKLLLLNSQAKQIVMLAPLRKTPKEITVEIGRLIPEGISVSQWDYDDSKLRYTLTGTAQTRDELIRFKTILEQSSIFADITLPLESLERPIDSKFTFTFIAKK